MGWWEERVVPHLVEATCGTGAVRWHRRLAVEGLGHAAELARSLALHYAREARAAAQ